MTTDDLSALLDVNAQNDFGVTLLHEAAAEGDLAAVRWLLAREAGGDPADTQGETRGERDA